LHLAADRRILIIGIDSQLGAALAEFLVSKNVDVYGTTKNNKDIDEKTYYFDFLELENSLPLSFFNFVVVCAGITNIKECEENKNISRLINVTKTVELIGWCLNSGCFVIYPSSNAVFNGTKAFNHHDDEPMPISMYGKFKLEVEDYIARNSRGNAAVIRFTKIISKRSPFLRSWLENVEKGLEISVYRDKVLSPVSVEDAVEAIYIVLERRCPGLFQLGGSDEVTYFDYACALFAGHPEKLKLLRPVDQPELKPYFNHHNSLVTRLPK
jgi:dTDP-4-dehydrorhamnose reductase